MALMQNLRYGVSTLEQNLRTAGIGVAAKQPVVVYASDRVVSFNADYATNRTGDVFAVYHDPGAPDAEVFGLTKERRFTIPGSSFAYPDSTYTDGGGTTPAETITFYFALDNTTVRMDDYALYRQVNDRTAEVIARGLLQTDRPFFTYYTLQESGNGSPVTEVPLSYLPGAHTVAIHGSPGDTGIVAGVDSVRAVRVTYAATNGIEGERDNKREISRLIRLPNAGLATQRTCGNKPMLGVTLSATGTSPTSTTPGHIHLSWGRATDEYTGERDVIRYVIWRRAPNTAFGDPLVSIPPGGLFYSYKDFSAQPNLEYQYGLAAQDCTPQYSPLSITGSRKWTP